MKRKETISKLKSIFQEKNMVEDVIIPEDQRKGYLDATNVLMFIPKTEFAKKLLVDNFEAGEEKKIPDLTYNNKDGLEVCSKYSTAYLVKVLEFLKVFDYESVILKTGSDYPLWVENKFFIVILAPRVGDIGI